jgi:hypothetical protein
LEFKLFDFDQTAIDIRMHALILIQIVNCVDKKHKTKLIFKRLFLFVQKRGKRKNGYFNFHWYSFCTDLIVIISIFTALLSVIFFLNKKIILDIT